MNKALATKPFYEVKSESDTTLVFDSLFESGVHSFGTALPCPNLLLRFKTLHALTAAGACRQPVSGAPDRGPLIRPCIGPGPPSTFPILGAPFLCFAFLLLCVSHVTLDSLACFQKNDYNTNGHTQWYYFAISNVRKDVTYR